MYTCVWKTMVILINVHKNTFILSYYIIIDEIYNILYIYTPIDMINNMTFLPGRKAN